jgi:hypothetical protein
MRWMRWALVVLAASGALPAAASAAVLAPPGHAGANQYFETIPTSSGQAAPPGSVRGSGTSSSSHALAAFGRGQATDAKLAKLGKPGRAAAALAASTAPAPATGAAAEAARAAAGSGASGGSGGSIGSGVWHALGSSNTGGLGLLLPLLLATALLVALGIVAASFRSRDRPAGPSSS